MLRVIAIDSHPNRSIDELVIAAVTAGGIHQPAEHGAIIQFASDREYIWLDEDDYESSAEDMSTLRGIPLEVAQAAFRERPAARSFVVEYSRFHALWQALQAWRAFRDLRVCGWRQFWTVDHFLSAWKMHGPQAVFDPKHIAGWGDE